MERAAAAGRDQAVVERLRPRPSGLAVEGRQLADLGPRLDRGVGDLRPEAAKFSTRPLPETKNSTSRQSKSRIRTARPARTGARRSAPPAAGVVRPAERREQPDAVEVGRRRAGHPRHLASMTRRRSLSTAGDHPAPMGEPGHGLVQPDPQPVDRRVAHGRGRRGQQGCFQRHVDQIRDDGGRSGRGGRAAARAAGWPAMPRLVQFTSRGSPQPARRGLAAQPMAPPPRRSSACQGRRPFRAAVG